MSFSLSKCSACSICRRWDIKFCRQFNRNFWDGESTFKLRQDETIFIQAKGRYICESLCWVHFKSIFLQTKRIFQFLKIWWFLSDYVFADKGKDVDVDDVDCDDDDVHGDEVDDDQPWIVMVSPSCRIVLLFPKHSPGFARTETSSRSLLSWS